MFKCVSRTKKRNQNQEFLDLADMLEVGGMTINIERVDSKCKIYAASQFSYDNKGAANTIVSSVDMELNLIDEKRVESLCVCDRNMVCSPIACLIVNVSVIF